MSALWTEPARELVDRLGVGLDALWALVFTAQIGALQLALIDPLDGDLVLTDAATQLAEALEELEWVCPELTLGGMSIDLGPVPWDDLIAYRSNISGLLAAAIDVIAELLRTSTPTNASIAVSNHPAGGTQLDPAELLAVTRVVHLVSGAYQLVIGPVR